jgi:hypothetical protein
MTITLSFVIDKSSKFSRGFASKAAAKQSGLHFRHSVLGKPLAFPTKFRLASDERYSLFCHNINDEDNVLFHVNTYGQCCKTLFFLTYEEAK